MPARSNERNHTSTRILDPPVTPPSGLDRLPEGAPIYATHFLKTSVVHVGHVMLFGRYECAGPAN